MIVADTNIIAYLLIAGDKTALAQETYRQDRDWIVPKLWRHEFLNVLASFLRFGGGQREDGHEIWARGIALFGEREYDPDMAMALDLSIEFNASAYDTQFVALAQSNGSRLITEDQKLLKAFPDIAKSMREFLRNTE